MAEAAPSGRARKRDGKTHPSLQAVCEVEDVRASDGILNAMRQARWDPFAATASALALIMLLVYLWVIRQQQEGVLAAWAVAALIVGAAAAGLGAVVAFPYRRCFLGLAAVLLILLGVLAILTIGSPILVAGILCIVAGWRSRPAPDA